MFRAREPVGNLFQSKFTVTPKKAKLLERGRAAVFRNEALLPIDEDRLAPMYCADNRPSAYGCHVGKNGDGRAPADD